MRWAELQCPAPRRSAGLPVEVRQALALARPRDVVARLGRPQRPAGRQRARGHAPRGARPVRLREGPPPPARSPHRPRLLNALAQAHPCPPRPPATSRRPLPRDLRRRAPDSWTGRQDAARRQPFGGLRGQRTQRWKCAARRPVTLRGSVRIHPPSGDRPIRIWERCLGEGLEPSTNRLRSRPATPFGGSRSFLVAGTAGTALTAPELWRCRTGLRRGLRRADAIAGGDPLRATHVAPPPASCGRAKPDAIRWSALDAGRGEADAQAGGPDVGRRNERTPPGREPSRRLLRSGTRPAPVPPRGCGGVRRSSGRNDPRL